MQTQLPQSDPRTLIAGFREELLRSGVSDAEVEQTMPLVWRCAFQDRKAVRFLWNKVYAGDAPIFLDAPNKLMVEFAEQRAPGKALDVGMGQGRNSLYLALEGWEVTGFDPSDEGIRIAQANADKADVEITTVVATDVEFDFGTERWDLIVVTYVKALGDDDAERVERALRPGGVFVYENSAADDNQLLRAFANFRILRFEDVLDYPDWNPEQKTRLHRLVAQKR